MPPQEANARSLPKFGEWDVNNPASGEGFTVIFNKARDEKKTSSSSAPGPVDNKNAASQPYHDPKKHNKPKKLLCCFYGSGS